MTNEDDEYFALCVIAELVLGYWLVVQICGWLFFWFIIYWITNESLPGYALFLATSAFHNAGLVTYPDGLLFKHKGSSSLLFVVCVLIMLGNTCFPIALRWIVQVSHALSRSQKRQHARELLLKYPRTCYTHMFPAYATRWLIVVTPLLIVVQILALLASDFFHGPFTKAPLMEALTYWERILATVFQAVSTRTAGFSVVDLSRLSPASAFVFCVCMWISTCPVVSVIRSTARIDDGRVVSEYFLGEVNKQAQKDAESVKQQLNNFLGQNMAKLVVMFYLILLSEQYNTDHSKVRDFRMSFIIFEFCSAYGTVGLSMSNQPWSRSGDWSASARLILMMVMFLGRLRGLPESIDPAVRFVNEYEPEKPMGVTSTVMGLFTGGKYPSLTGSETQAVDTLSRLFKDGSNDSEGERRPRASSSPPSVRSRSEPPPSPPSPLKSPEKSVGLASQQTSSTPNGWRSTRTQTFEPSGGPVNGVNSRTSGILKSL